MAGNERRLDAHPERLCSASEARGSGIRRAFPKDLPAVSDRFCKGRQDERNAVIPMPEKAFFQERA